MILEDNYSGEKRKVETEEELCEILDLKLSGEVDFSLGDDKDHYVQAIPGLEPGQFHIGYKDGKGYRGFLSKSTCSQEKAKEFFLQYFRHSPDWQKEFEWDEISTGPVWLPYAFLVFVACFYSLVAWTENKTHHLWWVWGIIIAIMLITIILVKSRRVTGAVLDFLGEIKKK